MSKTRTIGRKRIDKYLSFLVVLYQTLQHNKNISMDEMIRIHRVSKSTGRMLKQGGIIAHNGKRGEGSEWTWKTIEPNREMASELCRRLSNHAKTFPSAQQKKPNRELQMDPLKQTEQMKLELKDQEKERKPRKRKKTTSSISWLWGLYKKTTTIE